MMQAIDGPTALREAFDAPRYSAISETVVSGDVSDDR